MSRLKEISAIIETIDGSTKPVTLKIAAWPYSRTIIKGICENNLIDLKINRLSKDHEEFVLKAGSDTPEKIKKIMSLVNKEAKESGNKITSERNVIADKIRKNLGLKPEVKEVKEKPVKVAKAKTEKKPVAKKAVEAKKAPVKTEAKKVVAIKKAEKPKASLAEKKAKVSSL